MYVNGDAWEWDWDWLSSVNHSQALATVADAHAAARCLYSLMNGFLVNESPLPELKLLMEDLGDFGSELTKITIHLELKLSWSASATPLLTPSPKRRVVLMED